MHYFLMIAGILIMCVPEGESFLRFAVQGAVGLGMFVTGVVLALEKNN